MLASVTAPLFTEIGHVTFVMRARRHYDNNFSRHQRQKKKKVPWDDCLEVSLYLAARLHMPKTAIFFLYSFKIGLARKQKNERRVESQKRVVFRIYFLDCFSVSKQNSNMQVAPFRAGAFNVTGARLPLLERCPRWFSRSRQTTAAYWS